jgi:fatty acid desaturase
MLRASRLLGPAEIHRFGARSDMVGAALVLHAWLVIAAAMALFARWPNPLTLAVAIMIIGGRQLGLAILMHDAAHGLLFRRRAVNDRIAQWLCAYPVVTDLHLYRPYHLKHHRLTQQADDPDLPLSAPFPITRASLRRKILRDLTGRTGYQRRKAQLSDALGPSGTPWRERAARLRRRLGGAALVNAALFSALALAGYWWLYPLLWLLPLMTWYQLVSRIRNIAEHAVVPDNDDPWRNTRTTLAGPGEGGGGGTPHGENHARGPVDAAGARALPRQPPPRASPLSLRAVLAPAAPALPLAGGGVWPAHGALPRLSRGSRARHGWPQRRRAEQRRPLRYDAAHLSWYAIRKARGRWRSPRAGRRAKPRRVLDGKAARLLRWRLAR